MTTSRASVPATVARVESAAFGWADAGDMAATAAEAVRRVVAEATEADGRAPLDEQTLLSLRHSGLSGSSLWNADSTEQPGRSVGFLLVDTLPRGSRSGRPAPAEANLVIAPSFRGKGIGRVLAATLLEHFADRRLSAWSHGNHPAAQVLASSLGFERVRDLWLMRRLMSGDLPPVQTPEGTVVRGFRPGSDEEAFLELNAAAFAGHPEQGSMTRADLDRRMDEPWFDPAGFLVAEREGPGRREMLGFHWTKLHAAEPSYGEVYVVGVSPSAQGTGLGGALTLAGLHHLQAAGVPEVVLYVESDNGPAIKVYQRLGFTHAAADTDVMYRR